MAIRLLLLFLLFSVESFAQQKLLRFIEQVTGKPVQDADVYADTVFIATTNYNGNVKADVSGAYNNLVVSHVNYERRVIPRDSLVLKKVYTVKKLDHVLDEVVVSSDAEIDSTTSVHWNFSYGMKAATLIDAAAGSTINQLRFRVTNGVNSGVKGLNYLPFMANVYEIDTITKLPGKALLPEDVLVENKSGADWATVDVSSYRLKIPQQGACVVFIIPEFKDDGIYKTFWISSKNGLISAVPNLKHQPFPGKANRSFLYNTFVEDYGKTGGTAFRWKLLRNAKYVMEAVCADDKH